MRAAVTRAPGRVEVEAVAAPGPPGHGQALLRPELVGVCGSDLHFFEGHLPAAHAAADSPYPRIQGHEICAVVEALGPASASGLSVGDAVAVLPLSSCGTCYPCSIGRPSVCTTFQLLGVHRDGGLAEELLVDEDQCVTIGSLSHALGAFVEPMAVAVHAVRRSRLAADEQVLVLGGGPIGQASALACRALGGRVSLVEPIAARREIAIGFGVEEVLDPLAESFLDQIRTWSRGQGAPIVLDTTGSPSGLRDAVELVASAGRIVVIGISDRDVALPLSRFTEKEIDIVGSACYDRVDFDRAVEIVRDAEVALAPRLLVEFPLEAASEAMRYAGEHPESALKVLVRVAS